MCGVLVFDKNAVQRAAWHKVAQGLAFDLVLLQVSDDIQISSVWSSINVHIQSDNKGFFSSLVPIIFLTRFFALHSGYAS